MNSSGARHSLLDESASHAASSSENGVDRGQGLQASAASANVTCSDPGTFSASFEDAKTVVHMLQSLATGKRDQFACVVVSDSALRFSVETASKNLLGVAYITVRAVTRSNIAAQALSTCHSHLLFTVFGHLQADILSELRVPLQMDSKQVSE